MDKRQAISPKRREPKNLHPTVAGQRFGTHLGYNQPFGTLWHKNRCWGYQHRNIVAHKKKQLHKFWTKRHIAT
jgi:hypothetical protein